VGIRISNTGSDRSMLGYWKYPDPTGEVFHTQNWSRDDNRVENIYSDNT
jgi:hypothetical protein